MKQSVNLRIIVGFIIAIGLVLIVGSMSYSTFKKQTQEALMVKHTYRVLNRLELLQKTLLDMETGRRGFRSTGDKIFLEPYYKAQPKIEPILSTLREQVSDNPLQIQNMQELEEAIGSVQSLWNGLNIAVAYENDEQRYAITMQEKKLMDNVRAHLEKMSAIENRLLAQREQENTTAVDRAILSLAIGTFLILIVVFALISVTVRELMSRRKAQHALEENFRKLDDINRDTNNKNWLLSGVTAINTSISDLNDFKELTHNCLDTILDYLHLPAGAFYFFDERSNSLNLTASIGLQANVQQRYRLNEGLTGKAAAKKDVIVEQQIPAGYWTLSSASGARVPDSLIFAPLWLDNQLKGVFELAAFGRIDNAYVELLSQSSNAIAMAFAGADANERVMMLLNQVQEQKEELETQQEELRQSNEELIRQSEVLQASEEELRVQGEELRQVNIEMEKKNDAIEHSRKELEQKAKELEISSKYKSEFLANMSHELRTPLNSVLILAKLLSDNKTSNLSIKQIEYAEIIHKSGTDLLHLINDILDLSKIEAGKIELLFEEITFSEINEDIRQLFRVVADQKQIHFTCEVKEGMPSFIYTDKQRLEQIIKNLLSNAFKFTPKDGIISVSFFKAHDNLCGISVTDTGIGIPQDKQQLIFEAFQQADGTTNRKYGGTGLGLSISKELVRRLGGELKLKSTPGEGSTFTLYLPFLHDPNGPEAPALTQTQVPAQISAPDFNIPKSVKEQHEVPDDRNKLQKGDPTILIVEDDKHFATILRDFARTKNYKTIVALQGDEGLYYADKYRPDAIILDIFLPVINGRTILNVLKHTEHLKNIPVHVISSEDATKLEIVHAKKYIQKPVAESDLEAVFLDINGSLQAHFKKILVVSDQDLLDMQILKALGSDRHPGIGYEHVRRYNNVGQHPALHTCDCIIVDINTDIKAGIACLKEVRELLGERNIPVIAFLETDIDASDEVLFYKYANTLIRNTHMASDRLVDELELFLYKIKDETLRPFSAPSIKGTDASLQGKKVLLADDDMRNVFALTNLLEEEGMHVITAADGREAIEQLKNNSDTDIVLMDIMMPEMDGYEAMEQIRSNGRFPRELPIIALTAKAMEQDREKCIQHGASDYITKPVDNNKLFSLMRVWLAK